MKTNILLFLGALCTSLSAQWTPIDSVTSENFLLVHFLNADTGFTYTQPGMMRKTTDGGQSWDSLEMRYKGFLHDMDFPSANVGYAVGGAWFPFGQHYGNAIQKTTDGGQTWDSLVGTYDHGIFTHIEAISETEFYSSGRFGLLHSVDGGNTFDTLNISSLPAGTENYGRIEFHNATTGYVMGYAALFGGNYLYNLYETTDAGQSWQSIYSDTLNTPTRDFVTKPNGDFLLSGMDGEMISSTDGGISWQVLGPSDTSLRFEKLNLAGRDVYAMAYSTADSTSGLYHSGNWGMSWQRQFAIPVILGGVIDMSFPSGEVGYFVTHYKIYKNSGLVSQPEFMLSQVSLYPNPADDFVYLELPETPVVNELMIVDVKGKVVRRIRTTDGEPLKIITSTFAEGLYYLQGHSTSGSIGLGVFVIRR